MSEFKAACGHMTTAKQLGQICPECHSGLYEQISLLVKEIFDARDILTNSVMGNLPDEWSLKDVCEARLHDIIALRNQVRDTCVRAEEAEAKLADCQSILRRRGHDTYCPAAICEKCSGRKNASYHHEANDPNDWCIFEPAGPCSDACGHDRVCGAEE